MPSLNMEGAYELTTQTIDRVVAKTSLGNYALGNFSGATFVILYIGRSDTDLNRRLKQWAGETHYAWFKFSYATSPKAAFEKECKNYHYYGGRVMLDNEGHPHRPEGTCWKCPMCDYFD